MNSVKTVTKAIGKKNYSCIRYFGGKNYLADNIIQQLPPHHAYVDLFAGGLHVFCKKTPSKVEVANDKDDNLINFLMVLRSDKEKLLSVLESLPTSRSLYEYWAKEPLPVEPFEKAIRWFYLQRQCIIPTPNVRTGWRSGKVKNSATDYQNAVKHLDFFEKRIRNIMIECLDFREIIERYDGKNVFFLCDPPYIGRENLYRGGFGMQDHKDLAEMLNNIKGKALVTHIQNEVYDNLYTNWHTVKVKNFAGGVIKTERGENRTIQTEKFYMNYNENIQQTLF
jgi:DNA adenine methylase